MSNGKGSFAITGATALTGSDLEPVAGATVVVDDGRIAPDGTDFDEVVDATGYTLIPGFIDAHVHIGFFDPRLVVRGGVTTVRDLAWPPQDIWPLVTRSADAAFEGPTIIAAGQMLTVPDGYPMHAGWAPGGTGRPIASDVDARAAVEEQVRAGACVIKIALNPAVGPQLEPAVVAAVVEAARSHGLIVTAHISSLDSLLVALEAGVAELAHCLTSPDRIPDEVIVEMVERDVVMVPTLSIFHGLGRRIAIENTARFVAAGGRVVYGTDLGNEGPRPGIDKREIKGMSAAGMPARAIIASATVDAASHLGLSSTGVLEAGRDADLVAVKGDPSSDPGALTKVAMVWRRGRRVR